LWKEGRKEVGKLRDFKERKEGGRSRKTHTQQERMKEERRRNN
jgi:hypothetical protein